MYFMSICMIQSAVDTLPICPQVSPAGELGRCSGEIASAMLTAIAAFARRKSLTSQRRVCIVIYNSPPQFVHFCRTLQKIFDKATSRPAFGWLAKVLVRCPTSSNFLFSCCLSSALRASFCTR